MVPAKIKQYQQQSELWKKTLEFLLRENAFLKNRLAELIRNSAEFDKDFLETAEQYQGLFLREDESINLLRRDVANFEKWLAREIYEDGHIINGVLFKRAKLVKDINRAQQEFNKLKKQFNRYTTASGI
jgi:hypothetical protein